MPTVRTNERVSEQPGVAPAAREMLSLRRALERQREIQELRANVGGSPPLSPESADKLMQRRRPAFSFQRLFDVLLGRETDIAGLGFTVPTEQIRAMPMQQRVNVLRQLAWVDQRGLDAIGRLKFGILRATIERQLFREGYRKVDDVRASSARRTAVETSVRDVLTQGGQALPAGLAVRGLAPSARPQLVGVLSLDARVPAGWYLHLSQDGLPLYVAPHDLTQEATAPSIPLYRRDPHAQPQRAPTTPEEKLREHAEFLGHVLQPGDILLTSEDRSRSGPFYVFRRMIRWLSARYRREASLPYTHAMVYAGRGKILHIRMAGKEELTVEETLRRYPHLSVCRPRAPRASRQQFAESMQTYAREEVQSFNTTGVIWQGIQNVRRKIAGIFGVQLRVEDTTAQPGSCVCIDYVSEPARSSQNGAIRSLGNVATPLEAMAHESIEVLYSVDVNS